MEPQRYLRCLGHPVLFAATGEPIRFRTRKHLALLVYLAVEARSHRRDRLAELLWPKVSASEARHSLATALSTLRPRLGFEGLESGRDHVRLAPGRVVLDLERLHSGDVLGSEVTGSLEVSGFLEGFDITDSAEFTHWKDRQQARLLPVIKDALLILIDRCRRTGDTRQIEQLADRMLALDELSEEAIRAKMEARAFAGDRLTALEIFEEWKAKLAEELHAAPSDLLEGMAVRLRRRGWERTTLTNIPNVPTDQWRGRPFIGRAAEYRVLYELWEGVKKGVPGHALILGDSGVGKTTLVQRLTTAAGLEGAAISRVQCYDVEREIPYSTLSSLVLGLLDRPGVSATAPEDLGELARIVPEVRHRFPNIPPPCDTQGEATRIRLTEAFQQMLSAISDEHPVILVIDDLHLADDVSLAVLHLIMRRSRGRAIMVVFIARPGEISQSSQAMRLRDTGTLGIREIDLLPLCEDEARKLLRSLIQTDRRQPDVSDERTLLRAAAGYPMVIELLVEDWKMSGDKSLALSINAMTADLDSGGPAHASYHRILDRITRSLDSTTHNVLNMASLLGHRLNDLSLYALVDLSVSQTMSGMAELVHRKVLRDGAQGLEFVNELVRGAAYFGVPPTLRRMLHGNIANCFIQQNAGGGHDLGLQIAWHCIRAGRNREATPYLLTGARQAMRRGALDAAERGLSTALPHLEGIERAEAVIVLADVLQEQGRWLDSLNFLDAQPRSDDIGTLRWIEVLTLCAKANLNSLSQEEIREGLSRLRTVITEDGPVSLRIAAAQTAALLVADIRNQSSAKFIFDSLSSIPIDTLSVEDRSKLALAKAMLMYHLHDSASSLHEIEAETSLIDTGEVVTTTAARLQLGLATLRCAEGGYAAALSNLNSAHGIAVRLGNDALRGTIAANLALAHGRLGDYPKQLSWAEETLSLKQGGFATYNELLAAYCAAAASIYMGRGTQATEFIATANSRISEGLPSWALQAWLLYSADLYLLLGDNQRAQLAGLSATQGSNATLHARGFAGIYCRWTASLAGTPRAMQSAIGVILGFVEQLNLYDALDRAEILAALVFLRRKAGQPFGDFESLLFSQLNTLPVAVTHEMGRLLTLDRSPAEICYLEAPIQTKRDASKDPWLASSHA
jgi:DNA-binding SARP family transcriptional activator/type II secretory pathway predicted ATPase ExeA/tetratricopeptide (TPR) repeat protein